MTHTTGGPLDHLVAAEAKKTLQQAERGHDPEPHAPARTPPASSASVEAAEQEAADGPDGLGLSR